MTRNGIRVTMKTVSNKPTAIQILIWVIVSKKGIQGSLVPFPGVGVVMFMMKVAAFCPSILVSIGKAVVKSVWIQERYSN